MLGFLALPTVVLLESIEGYWRAVAPKRVLGRSGTSSTPHRDRPAAEPRFVRFRFNAPKAKSVTLAGDFNLWSRESLSMKKSKSGEWEALVPLPPGVHHYLFSVDGEWAPDPKNPDRRVINGVETSVLSVP